MTEHFNQLSEAEVERLAILVEECSEVQKVACKILRHGYDSHNPDKPEAEPNRAALAREIGDLMHAVNRMLDARDVDGIAVAQHSRRKAEQIATWLHHQDGAGAYGQGGGR
jgi:hypothetical protein